MQTLRDEYSIILQEFGQLFSRRIWDKVQLLLAGANLITSRANFGLDDTIERRRGANIKAKGIYRDPARSSHSHMVKASGLRWLSLMLLAPIPWAGRV